MKRSFMVSLANRIRWAMGIAGAGVALSSVVAACSGAFVGSAAEDASTSPIEASVSDAASSVDGTVSEAGPDGGDGSARPEAGCGAYPGATFCVDFERPDPLGLGTWSETDYPDASTGVLSLVSQPVVSPRNAARFDLNKLDSGGCDYLRLERRFTGSFGGFTARTDLMVEGEGLYFTLASDGAGSNRYSLIVGVSNRAVSLLFQKYDGNQFSTVSIEQISLDLVAYGRWLPISLEFVEAQGKTVRFSVGSQSLSVPAPMDYSAKNLNLGVGPYCMKGPAKATVDDVVLVTVP